MNEEPRVLCRLENERDGGKKEGKSEHENN